MDTVYDTIAWVSSTFSSRLFCDHHDRRELTGPGESKWIPLGKVGISVNDSGFRQSAVAVERLRTYSGRILELEPHLIRYRRTLDFLGIDLLIDDLAIFHRIDELIERNRHWCNSAYDFGITMVATPGEAAQSVTEIFHLNPLDQSKIDHQKTNGQPLVVTSVKQPPPDCWPRDIKVRCRLHYYLADRQARQFACDAIGVLLDSDGSITETSVANLAVVVNGEVISPPCEQVLPGITQGIVQRIATTVGIPWRRATIYPAELRTSDEVILMGTDGGIWFANRVDGHSIHGEQPGEVYLRLLTGFDDYVRQRCYQ